MNIVKKFLLPIILRVVVVALIVGLFPVLRPYGPLIIGVWIGGWAFRSGKIA